MTPKRRFDTKPTVTSLALSLIALAAATALLFILIGRVQLTTGDFAIPPMQEAGRVLLSLGFIGLTLLAAGALYWHRQMIRDGLRPVMPIIVGGGLLIMAAAFVFQPISSVDVYYYGLSARGWALHGLNPYAGSPLTLTIDPLWPMVDPEADHPTIYGPFVTVAYALPTLLTTNAGAQIYLIKLISVVCYLLAGRILFKALSKRSLPWARLFFSFWLINPQAALEIANNGHNDGLLILALALMAAGLIEQDVGKALPGIVYGAFIKYWPAILLPSLLALPLKRLKQRLPKALGLSALALFALIPFMGAAINLPDLLVRIRLDNPHFFGPVLGLLASVLLFIMGQSPAAITIAKWISLGLIGLTATTITVLMARRRLSVGPGAIVLLLCPLMVAPQIFPWYWMSTLPLLALLRPRPAIIGFLTVAAVGMMGYSAAWAVIFVSGASFWCGYRLVIEPSWKILRKLRPGRLA